MRSEKEKFQQDLLESVKQMRSGQPARSTVVKANGTPDATNISLNLPAHIIERWKASGPDWQLRMAKLLSDSSP